VKQSPVFSRTSPRLIVLAALLMASLALVSSRVTQAHRSLSIVVAAPTDEPVPMAGSTSTVNSLGDAADTSVGNGLCDSDSGTPGDQCTLRAAIQEANAVFGDDTINISVTGVINLTGALPNISSNITITGPGSASLTVRRDTGGIYRIFTINSGTISISGMTISNGRTADGVLGTGNNVGPSGGGILQSSGSLTLTDVVLTGNTTGKGYDDLSSGGSLGGFGGFGGGIDVTGTLVMTNCVVSNNTTGNGGQGGSGGSGGRGAGIFTEANAQVTLQNVTITGNVTGTGGGPTTGQSGYGAGIWSGGSGFQATATLNMTNVTISNNSTADANDTTGSGAGLYVIAGTATLNNCTVSNNHTGNSSRPIRGAGRGAGIFNNGTMRILASTISGNSTGNGDSSGDSNVGGGIDNNFILTMIDSTVSGNSTGHGSSYGGGIYSSNLLNLINCTVTGNIDSDRNIHGIAASNQVNIRNSIIARNGPGGAGPDMDATWFAPTLNSQGHNLIGNPGALTGFNAPGDQVGADPLLGPLADNGGTTFTHALLPGSPALDAGDNCVTEVTHCGDSNIPQIITDQRGSGFSRIVDGPDPGAIATVDIGAYEKQAVFPNLADATTNEDTQLKIAFDLDDIASVTSVTATSSNSTLVPNNAANIDVTVAASTAILTINPAANLSGNTNITVTVNRTGGSANTTFALTVVGVNDAPSFTKGADQSVNENAGAQTVNNWATNILAGPADEAGQTLTFQVVSDSNPGLFSATPAISSTGVLTYTAATGASGTAAIVIALKDNGGTTNGGNDTSPTQTFNINVLEGGALQLNFSYFVSEGGANAVITVSRVSGSSGEARIDYASSSGTATANQDYTPVSGTLIFPNGTISQNFSVPILNDTFDENDETVSITLSNPAGTGSLGSPSTATLTIQDDDPRPTLSINDVQLPEGNSGTTNFVFTATLTGQTSLQVVTNYQTSTNTANFTDFQPVGGQLIFAPGETSKTITVPVLGDTTNEPSETFFLDLVGATNANLIKLRGVGTIVNDDNPRIQFSSSTFSPNEGDGSATITLTRTGDPSISLTVKFATSDTSGLANCGTVSGVASERCDYVTSIGSVTFASGETAKTLTIPLIDDALVEGNENFTVSLTGISAGQIGIPSTATVTILDNDSAPATANPIDGVDFFVRQQYLDILGRQPDQTGFQNWVTTLSGCPNGGFGEPPTSNCDRLHVAAGFFQSDEFLNRGYWAFRFYMVSFNQRPTYAQFIPDMSQVGGPKSPAEEEASKVAFADAFVQRPAFLAAYGSLNGQSLANALLQTAGLPAGSYNAGAQTNGAILRGIAESKSSLDKFLTEGTVSILYFGFQRRDPDTIGYQNNVNTLNADPNNLRHLIFIFIYSTEYRGRFGPT